MPNRTPTYEDLVLENERLKKLVLEKTDISLIDSSKKTQEKLLKAKEKAEENESNLKLGQEIASMGNWKLDVETMEVSASDELLKIFEIDLKELTLDSFMEVVHPDDRAFDLKYIKDGMDNGAPWDIEHRLLFKDGRVKWVHAIGIPQIDESKTVSTILGIVQDITERKQAEFGLKESEERLNRSQKVGKIGHWEFNLNNNKLIWSNQVFALYERDLKLGQPSDVELEGYYYEKDHIRLKEYIVQIIETAKPVENFECPIILPSGRIIITIGSMFPVMDSNGVVIKIFGVLQDITDQKKIERELIESEKRFRSIVEQSPLSTILFKPDGRTLQVNQAFENLWGITLEDVKDYNVLEDEQLESLGILTYIKRAFVGEATSIPAAEYDTVKSLGTGKKSWVQARIYPVKDNIGNINKVILIHEDITERKKSEEKLKESLNREKLMADIVRESVVGIAIGYPDGRLGMCNTAYQNITGYSEEELKTINWNAVLTPPEWEESESAELQKLQETKKAVKYEKEYIKKDGSRIPVELIVNPQFDDDGNVECYLAFVLNITNRKEAEQAVSLSNSRYKSLFNNSPIPLWEEDLTDLLSYLLELKEQGYKDLHSYFENNPNEIIKCAGMVKVLDVNLAALKLHKANSKEELIENLSKLFTENSFITLKNELLALVEGKEIYECEAEIKTLQGDLKNIYITLKIDRSQPGKVIALLATLDISKQKKAEQLVLKNTTRLNYALRSIKTGAWELDLETQESWRTFKHDQIFGHNKPFLEWTYNTFLEHVIPEDREIVDQKFQHSIRTKTDWNFECRIKRKNDGEIRWIWGNGSQELNEQNKPIKMFGVVQDITEKKQAEKELRESNELFNLAMAATKDGLYDWNLETNEISYSIGWENMFGYTQNELTKDLLEFNKLIDPESVNEIWEKQQELINKQRDRLELEFKMKHKDGHFIDVLSRAEAVFDKNGKAVRVVGTTVDITERKKTDNLLRESEAKFSSAFNKSPIALNVTDFETGERISVNDKFVESFGYSRDELLGDNLFQTNIAIDNRELMQAVNQIKGEGFLQDHPFQTVTKNGDVKHLLLSAAKINSKGKNQFIVSSVDITQQKKIEQELIKAKEKAEESDRLKSAFLANMSHEIRTPMNGILGFINLLNEPNLNKHKIDAYSKIINKSGNRLLNTINDIIDISKVESGEMDVTMSKVYLNNELDELYSFHSAEANSNGLALFIEPSLLTNEVAVLTDGHKLHGILTNLIKNAIKYTKTGFISFGYSIKNDFIEFFVKDTGMGIPKHRLKAIFNRFEQADIEDAEVFEGSGLGLAISKAYTEMLGGEIFVESEEGEGSKFIFTIPLKKEKDESIIKTTETIDNNTLKFGDLNLLIVDDDDISSKLLEIMLEGVFKKIVFANTGFEAIQLCENNPDINLVLMDIRMPEMDGYDATREIRKFNKDLIIIAQTAYVLPGDKEKTLEAGCNDYISKPISKELLLEVISENINKKRIK